MSEKLRNTSSKDFYRIFARKLSIIYSLRILWTRCLCEILTLDRAKVLLHIYPVFVPLRIFGSSSYSQSSFLFVFRVGGFLEFESSLWPTLYTFSKFLSFHRVCVRPFSNVYTVETRKCCLLLTVGSVRQRISTQTATNPQLTHFTFQMARVPNRPWSNYWA